MKLDFINKLLKDLNIVFSNNYLFNFLVIYTSFITN